MRSVAIFLVAVLVAVALSPVSARAQEQTLADIRQELRVLYVQLQQLNRELSTTGSPSVAIGGDTLQRVDLIEQELSRLTAKTEELENRISRVVRDGTNAVGDLEFRLCELEAGCDVAQLGDTPMLGGEAVSTGVTPMPTPSADTELAVGEQADFDRAKAALDQGDFRGAADLFAAFTQDYTGGPLTSQAHFLRGQALAGLGETSAAARAFLQSYSGDPKGPRAADALLELGRALGDLGQQQEACTMLSQVGAKFPGSAAVAKAEASRQELGCA